MLELYNFKCASDDPMMVSMSHNIKACTISYVVNNGADFELEILPRHLSIKQLKFLHSNLCAFVRLSER